MEIQKCSDYFMVTNTKYLTLFLELLKCEVSVLIMIARTLDLFPVLMHADSATI